MRAWIWGAVIGLAGCATTGAAPVGVQTVQAVAKPGVAAPVARGETQLVVRTVTTGAPGQEFVGAACLADTPWFQAKFTSPARILMPDLGASAPTVTVTCRSGTATGTAAAPPVAAWSGGLRGWPAVGVSVGTGDVNGLGVGLGWYGGGVGGASGVPVTRYNELQVELR